MVPFFAKRTQFYVRKSREDLAQALGAVDCLGPSSLTRTGADPGSASNPQE
jgi:hypothetical protein